MQNAKQKWGAILLAVALLLGACGFSASTAFADTTYDKNVTLTGLANGEVVHAYKLMSYDDSYNTYVYDGGFGGYLDAHKSADQTRDQYFHSITSSTDVAKMLDTYLHSTTYTKPADTEYTVSGTEQKVTLEPGYYMFTVTTTGTESNMYKPFSAFVKVDGNKSTVIAGSMTTASDSDVTVAMKSEKGPSIVKAVKRDNGTDMASSWKTTKTVGNGDTVTYRVALTIPDWKDIVYPELKLIDTLNAQQYVKGSVAIYTTEGDETSNYLPTDAVDGAISEEVIGGYDTTSALQSLTFAIDYSKLTANHTYYITYQTTVQDEVTTSMKATNSALVKYNSSQTSTSTTTESKTTLYTYAAQLTKQDLNGSLLDGSSFTIYSDETCTTAVKFEKVTNNDGTFYYRPSTDGTVTEIAAEGTTESFLLKGLDPYHTYYFKETTTPKGYYAPTNAFNLQLVSQKLVDDDTEHSGALSEDSAITPLDTADSKLVSGSVDQTSTNQFDIVIKNSTTPTLPVTGGMGTVIIMILGVVLMVSAVTLFAFRRRNRA
ncbi:MAG: isopeptide-forming domain-containing fimbrial protein [Phoenicibacter congonensis]|uniref:Isopeptide-forming domain-containing fimbrial protein n=1 Tax=Phoenicibacter congonensis TaxID=1944646 RepID=A0AA43UB27_9ACTN|nr:isopeptide-forming domain-containing fimbrial protein [Phoenicibacter congonensis]